MENKLQNFRKVYFHGPYKSSGSYFDEYDAMRPDVALLTKVLEAEGGLTCSKKIKLLNQIILDSATANTVGLGDTTGLYTGTQQINQAQMDRWNIVTTLNYLIHEKEMEQF